MKKGKLFLVNTLNISNLILLFFLLFFFYIGRVYSFFLKPTVEYGLFVGIYTFLFMVILVMVGRGAVRNRIVFKKDGIDFGSSIRFLSDIYIEYDDIDKLWLKGTILRIKSKRFGMGGLYVVFTNKNKLKNFIENRGDR